MLASYAMPTIWSSQTVDPNVESTVFANDSGSSSSQE